MVLILGVLINRRGEGVLIKGAEGGAYRPIKLHMLG